MKTNGRCKGQGRKDESGKRDRKSAREASSNNESRNVDIKLTGTVWGCIMRPRIKRYLLIG
jgi:hypothetical protein